jgi:hypothetical protein
MVRDDGKMREPGSTQTFEESHFLFSRLGIDGNIEDLVQVLPSNRRRQDFLIQLDAVRTPVHVKVDGQRLAGLQMIPQRFIKLTYTTRPSQACAGASRLADHV